MKYYFDLANHTERIIDVDGVEADSVTDARLQAAMAVAEIQREEPDGLDQWAGWRLEVLDAAGLLVLVIDLGRRLLPSINA
ncbi:DUF6894 family protein [Microvirga mediterraneensis]|uniref:DUF6894 domain-containing protein n=1 Tax=Microvirga mediterraneensis TaxID=2754695 RepID=A0A838BTT2_9HYPH|nr:hypothetical protein [Microvirga mediterraneensis]MBA1158947.1 hypothetical protein [Microvirga mediterraneensis]